MDEIQILINELSGLNTTLKTETEAIDSFTALRQKILDDVSEEDVPISALSIRFPLQSVSLNITESIYSRDEVITFIDAALLAKQANLTFLKEQIQQKTTQINTLLV